MNGPRVLFELPFFGGLPVTESMRTQWIVMAVILALCLFLTRGMTVLPKGRQVLAEKAVTMSDRLIDINMGKEWRAFSPYIAAILASSLFGSLASLFGLRASTADLNTTLGWALMTFALITFFKIRFNGLGGYFKGFLSPVFIMAPLNVLSEIATPVSMSFRHFGNMAGGLVITTLLLQALAAFSDMLHLPVPLFQIGLPGILSLYFDLFTACMQAYIFSMLTMAYVGAAKD